MELHLLIAEPHEAQRDHLCAIYSASPLVTHIDEATNREELCYKLENVHPDFVVVNQSLITNIALLPLDSFIFTIITAEPDIDMLIAAYRYGVRSYCLENPLPPAAFLTGLLESEEQQIVLGPRITSWVLEYIAHGELPTVKKVLTAREQNILALWNEGLSSSAIGKRLIISNGTVKKELEHIRAKLRQHNIGAIMRKGRAKMHRDV